MAGEQSQLQYPSIYSNVGPPLADQSGTGPADYFKNLPDEPKKESSLGQLAKLLATPRGQLMWGIPTLALTVVIYFAFVQKKVEKWPWYAKFFAWFAIYGVLQTSVTMVSYALPGPKDEKGDDIPIY